MALALDQVSAAIQRQLPGVAITVEGATFIVEAKDLVRICQFLKVAPDYQLDYVANLTAVDYPPERIEMVYHFYSMAKKHGPVTLKVKLPRATPVVGSLSIVYRGAEYQEREVWDLYGVKFEGHPDLRRILMWEGFEGHPMRKDYVVEDQDAPEANRRLG